MIAVIKSHHILDTVRPTFQTGETWCGPAVVQAVLAKYGVATEQEHLAMSMNTGPNGTSFEELFWLMRCCSVEVEDTDASVEVVYEDVRRGASAVLCVKAYGNGHYVCLVGDSRRNWFFADPSVESGFGFIPKRDFPRRLAVRRAMVVRGRSKSTVPVREIPE